MDNKTEELRDIFLEVADEETVTESQEAERGSLTGDERPVAQRLQSVVDEMREKFTFTADLSDEEYCDLVGHFYDGVDDAEMAEALSCSADEVFEARLDLHLVREDDPPGDVGESDLEAIRDRPADESPAEIAAELDLDRTAVGRARAVIDAENRSRRVSQRFRTAFEETLTDADLTVQLTGEAHDDGLDDATEGAEVDVDF
jgi:hypothetical protein